MKTSESITKIAPAVVNMQSELSNAEKTGSNPHFGSRYSTLAAVMEALRKPLFKNGLAIIQTAETRLANEVSDDRVVVVTRLQHESGEWYEGNSKVEAVAKGPQAYASSVTYLRRYGAMAITGLAPEDDDAEAAEARTKARTENAKKPEKSDGAMLDTWVVPWKLTPEALDLAKVENWKKETRKAKADGKDYEVVLVPGKYVATCLKSNTPAPKPTETKKPEVLPPVKPDPAPVTTPTDPKKASYKAAKECQDAMYRATTLEALDAVVKDVRARLDLDDTQRKVLTDLYKTRQRKIGAA
jgi:hypothetical protein